VHTLADPLEHARRTSASRLAVVSGDTRLTFEDLGRRCRLLAGALDRAGLARGERVAIWADNDHRYIETYLGVPASGRVVVPLNTRHAEPELVYALRDSGARVLLTDREPGALADCVERVVRLPDEYEAWLSAADETSLGVDLGEDDLAGLFYTGGTTGASKGVMLSHRNLVANAWHWMARVPHGPDDRILVMAPLFHAAGSNGVIGNVWTGGVQVVLPSFSGEGALDLIERERCTGTLGVPTMLAAITEAQRKHPRDTSTMRFIAHGGSPVASEVLRRLHDAIPTAELIEVYGATELSPLATVARHEETMLDAPRIRSCGPALPGVSVRVANAQGETQAAGEVGEVVVRGPTVMRGYWKKKEETEAVLRNGEYWTGDLGYMDESGWLFLVDRSKDMIVSGGENVYSSEVEEALYRHPAVLEAAVFGVPDERWGEAVWAAVQLRPGAAPVDAAGLIEFCRRHLVGYNVLKGIDLHAEPLPKSGPGKFLKRELRAPYWSGRDRAVN